MAISTHPPATKRASDNRSVPVPSRHLSDKLLPFAPLALTLAISACSTPDTGPKRTDEPVDQIGSEVLLSPPAGASVRQAAEQNADQRVERAVKPVAPAVVPAPPESPVRHNAAAPVIEEVVVTTASAEDRLARRQRAKQMRQLGASADQASASALHSRPGHYYYPPIHHPIDPIVHHQPNTERYPDAEDNPVKQVIHSPVSTFSIDVDTAAYANARRQINAGQLPRSEAIRVEEFINYFNYSYPRPDSDTVPFSITTEVGPSPWNADRKLMLVGLQGYEVERSELPPANLVFLIDVSGSMNSPQKLGLLKSSMKMLTKQLRPQDTISIAVYAGAAGEVLAPTSGRKRAKIMRAIDSLHAGGSTNGGAGIKLAYSLAQREFKDNGINRVILASDGDFNVGLQSTEALRKLVETKRKTGVSLTVLGFGAGNYNDEFMQELAQKGNGNAAYIDSIFEARKVLVDEIGATLETIAKDVKIQVEFNPDVVREYRLIGYETRALKREDFNNDTIDAGEIGAGHSVTALYELTMANANSPSVDELRYGRRAATDTDEALKSQRRRPGTLQGELAHVKLRYKAPQGDISKLVERIVRSSSVENRLRATSDDFRFAAAASAFGQLLRKGDYTGSFSYEDTLQLAQQARGKDSFGYRSEFERLLRTAAELAPYEDASHEAVSMR